MEVQILYRQGMSIHEISRQTGFARNTVRKQLRSDRQPSYGPRPPRPDILEPYKPYLAERISAALPHRIPSPVLLRELQQRGYQGSDRTLRNYLKTQYPPPPEEPLIRFETPPGQQMQADWCVFRRGKSALSAFVATLGYSRSSYVEFVTDEQSDTLNRCHVHAFEYFGGVPQEVLYDNMKTVVISRDSYGNGLHRFHPGLWNLAKEYRFTPRLCRPYRAKTKGKVERFNQYLRNSFYYPLVGLLRQSDLIVDKDTANLEVRKWLRDIANVRIHATTGEAPEQRMAVERLALQPLPRSFLRQPLAVAGNNPRWPIESLQRSPRHYDQLLELAS